MSEILIANAAGQVTGTHTVAARVAPVRSLAAVARGNWAWLVFAGVLIGTVALLESFDNDEVNKSIKHWKDAGRALNGEQFGAALDGVIPGAAEWDFDDRDAFDTFVRKLKAEVAAVADAMNANADVLTQARDGFNDAVDALVAALVPVLIAVIASIALQAFAPTHPIAQAIGVAGMTISAAILALVFADIASLLTAVGEAVRGNGRYAFVSDSRPGWAGSGADPNIRDIKIDWVLDDSAYRA